MRMSAKSFLGLDKLMVISNQVKRNMNVAVRLKRL